MISFVSLVIPSATQEDQSEIPPTSTGRKENREIYHSVRNMTRDGINSVISIFKSCMRRLNVFYISTIALAAIAIKKLGYRKFMITSMSLCITLWLGLDLAHIYCTKLRQKWTVQVVKDLNSLKHAKKAKSKAGIPANVNT